MSHAAVLLRDLDHHGIRIRVEGDSLKSNAPPGVMTDALRDAIREHKLELLDLLRAKNAPSAPASQAGPATGLPPPEPAESPPKGQVGEHRAPCGACGNTWYWPTVSEQTGHRGGVCATCFTASLPNPKAHLVQPGESGAPARPLASDPRLRVDEISERKGRKLLDIGNGSDRHHPEVLELDELPFRWRNQSGAPSRVHHHQCPLCGGAQLARADTRDLWYCGTCHAIRQLAIRSEPPVEIGTT